MRDVAVVIVILIVGLGVIIGVLNREDPQEQMESTEAFIHRWLKNDNGTIATYIQDSGEIDEDLVQGRESLAETVGLWMFYALGEEDQALFNEAYDQLEEYYLEQDGFVNWKLNEEGESEVSTNALIDDIRIVEALVNAYDQWDENQYLETATLISDYVTAHNVYDGIYTNFYERAEAYESPDITLSYIDAQALETIVDHGLLDPEIVAATTQVLTEAPLDNGFYPMSYNVEDNAYIFDQPINIVDQAFLAYHQARIGHDSEAFLAFIREEMENRGLVHGLYDRETKEPTVDYESPAIYGYLILYTLEVGEDELAQELYQRVKTFRVTSKNNEYYGGYSISDDNTHIFDNLVPLLAEQRINN